ncbi:three-Cys-motif partner protein TcmP [Longimycelium tulufanense]|uniref:three-Cys-motif partner protein TcmP n=1 Tax=Longimycelium tulufanense TaxID=907463 RepID=UPI0016689273|nr:three-Cys-motif partner protein TcmP [Longimycelium tulufanense]
MTANDKFFQKKQALAVLKHGILRRYLPIYATMTGSTSESGRVVYLDGYAGPGRYEPEEPGGVGAPGSPLLAVETAKRVQGWKRDLHCVFVERDPSYVGNLRAVLAEAAPEGMRYDVLPGDVKDRLGEALDLTGDRPLFAFLDPFGTALPYQDMVERLLGRGTALKTEVLLNFNLGSVWRIGGLLTGDEAEPNGENGRREAAISRVDAFLGGDWWRERFMAARRGEVVASRAAQEVGREFCQRIGNDAGCGSFTVPIRRHPNHEPLFLMILFFRHDAAPYQFNEAVSMANAEWRGLWRARDLDADLRADRERRGGQEDLFGNSLIMDYSEQEAQRAETLLENQWIEEVAENLRALTIQQVAIKIRENMSGIFGRTLGMARERHLRKAWDQLAEEDVLDARPKKGKMLWQTIYRRGR